MKPILGKVLSAAGVLFLLLAVGGVAAFAMLPKARMAAAVSALKGAPPAAAATPAAAKPVKPAGDAPVAVGILMEAQAKLADREEAFRRERALAETQLKAERAEVEAVKAAAEEKLELLAQERARAKAAPVAPAVAEASEKGIKAVAEISGHMDAKVAAQLLAGESEAGAARILRKMDPEQAGLVMSEVVAADPERARRIVSAMKEAH